MKVKDWKEIVKNSSYNKSELEIIKKLRAEYKKLYKGFASDLGKWIVKNERAIQVYIPEIYTAASLSLIENRDNSNTDRMYANIAYEFRKNLERYYDKE